MMDARFTDITLATLVYNDNQELLKANLRVLDYCRRMGMWNHILLLSAIEPPPEWKPFTVQIPHLTRESYQTFILKNLYQYVHGEHLMWVHEDGFPINWQLWDNAFLVYDFIGAPWADKVVGNDGFSILSKRLIYEMQFMPWHDGKRHSDEWICRDMAGQLKERKLNVAPFELAKRFSREYCFDAEPAFGFHNRTANTEDYKKGWELINNYERQ